MAVRILKDGVALGSKNPLAFTALDTPVTLSVVSNAGYLTPSVVITTADAEIEVSTDNAAWGRSVTFSDVPDSGTALYVRQTALLLYGEKSSLTCVAEDDVFAPTDYTFASSYFINADITALVA